MGNKIVYKGYNVGETTQVSIMSTPTADNAGAIVQYVGATNANYINGYFYKCVSDGGVTPAYSWEKLQVSDGGDTIQVETMPTADSTTEGRIVEYIGATTANYINGRFYRCVSDGASTPTYSWEEVDFGDGTPHWSGARAEYEAIKDTLEVGTIVNIVDDYEDGLEVVDVVEEDNMNPVTSNAVAKMCKCVSVGSLPDKVIPTTGTVITQLTLPKGKWMVFGQLHTNGFSTANQLLTLSISVNGSAAAGETVDQKVQVPGYWVFVHGMLYFEPTTEVTVKLVAVATEQITGVVKAHMIAIPVA